MRVKEIEREIDKLEMKCYCCEYENVCLDCDVNLDLHELEAELREYKKSKKVVDK